MDMTLIHTTPRSKDDIYTIRATASFDAVKAKKETIIYLFEAHRGDPIFQTEEEATNYCEEISGEGILSLNSVKVDAHFPSLSDYRKALDAKRAANQLKAPVVDVAVPPVAASNNDGLDPDLKANIEAGVFEDVDGTPEAVKKELARLREENTRLSQEVHGAEAMVRGLLARGFAGTTDPKELMDPSPAKYLARNFVLPHTTALRNNLEALEQAYYPSIQRAVPVAQRLDNIICRVYADAVSDRKRALTARDILAEEGVDAGEKVTKLCGLFSDLTAGKVKQFSRYEETRTLLDTIRWRAMEFIRQYEGGNDVSFENVSELVDAIGALDMAMCEDAASPWLFKEVKHGLPSYSYDEDDEDDGPTDTDGDAEKDK